MLFVIFNFPRTIYDKLWIISADDAGLQLGIYGNKVIRSPNIDSLAQQGTTFTNAFTSVSSCSPR